MKEASPAHRPDGAPPARGPRPGWLLLVASVAFLLATFAFNPASARTQTGNKSPSVKPPLEQLPQRPSLKLSPGKSSVSSCPGEEAAAQVRLTASGFDVRGVPVQYDWKVSGGHIEGKGASVNWILSKVPPGTYTATVTASVNTLIAGTRPLSDSARVAVLECRAPAVTCPKIILSCPKENFDDSQLGIRAVIEKGGPKPRGEVRHRWSLKAGSIAAGQGTPSIRIDPAGLAGQTVVATYEVIGYGLRCTQSCELPIISRPATPTPTPTPSPSLTPTPSPSPPATPPPSPAPSGTPVVGGAYRLWPWLVLAAIAALLVGAFAMWGRRIVSALADRMFSRGAAPPVPPEPSVVEVDEGTRDGGDVLTKGAEASAEGILVGGQKAVTDEVRCTVFAPFAAEPGDEFLVQAFAHLAEHAPVLDGLAKEAQRSAERRGAKELGQVARGEELVFHLQASGLEIDEPTQSIVWRGEVESVQFGVTVPEAFARRTVNCKLTVSHLSIPRGHIRFTIDLDTTPRPAGEDTPLVHHENFVRYRRAFISYSSQDRAEVLRRVQMLDSAGIEYFQDLLSLQPGEQWESLIYKRIDECDVFFLFWSTAARNSVWVEREVRRALERKGDRHDAPPEIIPVPIEGPPPVAPPQYLSSIHFNDKFLYFIHASDRGA